MTPVVNMEMDLSNRMENYVALWGKTEKGSVLRDLLVQRHFSLTIGRFELEHKLHVLDIIHDEWDALFTPWYTGLQGSGISVDTFWGNDKPERYYVKG